MSTCGYSNLSFQLLQLGASLITQGDVRAAADVQALQITGRHAVADEMKFERFHGKTPLSGKEFLFAVKFAPAVGILPGPCATKYALIVFSLA